MSPGGERVKVLDFGIAKLRPDWQGSDGPKTRTGVIFGTPAYMSPEQCRGLNDEVDAATDVYALGCILYEMLCGHAPYISPGWGDVLMMHMSDPVPVPSAENPRVPPSIDKVVVTALAKKKTDRFPSMRDMNRALAQARNEVQDTPAPVMKTDPAMPAIVLGIDGLATGASGGRAAVPARAPQDSIVAFEAFPPAPRRRLPMMIAGATVVGIVLAITFGLRSGKTVQPPAVVAPTPAAQPAQAPVPRSQTAPAAAKVAEPAEAAEPGSASGTEGLPPSGHESGKPTTAATKSTKPKAPKSHHHTVKRKDPAKW